MDQKHIPAAFEAVESVRQVAKSALVDAIKANDDQTAEDFARLLLNARALEHKLARRWHGDA